MNTLQKFEARQLEKMSEGSNFPEFSPGDTLRVNVRVVEGTRERIQAYEGVCIAKSGNGVNASFTVRKISYGEGVERVFPLYSPRIDSVELVRRGSVRRAKLYYLRERRGKKARISERTTGHGIDNTPASEKKAKKTAENNNTEKKASGKKTETKKTTAKKTAAKKTAAKK